MSNKQPLHGSLSGGYCLDCKSYYLSLQLDGCPEFTKHGFATEKEAHGKFLALSSLLAGESQPALDEAERLNLAFEILGVSDRVSAHKSQHPAEPMPDLGRPRYG